MNEAEFNHPRLVAVYDADCGWAEDDDFFVSVAGRAGSRVLDLGCGTGRLAVALAAAGRQVTGVDPARASLDAARVKPGADRVTWVEGTSHDLPSAAFDVAVMTSHVAQFLVDDEEWGRTLADLHRALVPGGLLAFDARDPDDRRWEKWNRTDSWHPVTLTDGSRVEAFVDVTERVGDVVSFVWTYRFEDGSELTSEATLRFRGESLLRETLAAHGFTVEAVYGGWGREPVGHPDGELVVLARR